MAWLTASLAINTAYLLLMAHCQSILSQGMYYPPAIAIPSDAVPSEFFRFVTLTGNNKLQCKAAVEDDTTYAFWRRTDGRPLDGWMVRNLTKANIVLERHGAALNDFNISYLNGTYECIVVNAMGTAYSGPVTFTVPDVHYALSESSIIGQEFETVQLPCSNVSSQNSRLYYPYEAGWTPYYNWEKCDTSLFGHMSSGCEKISQGQDGRMFMNSEGTLFIGRANKNDVRPSRAGGPVTKGELFYMCSIWVPSYSKDTTKIIKYSLVIAPSTDEPKSPTLVYSSPDTKVIINSTITLSCIFEENPFANTANVTWIKDGAPGKYGEENGGTLLTIPRVTMDHDGNWECSYKNATPKTIRVKVLSYPAVDQTGIADKVVFAGETAHFHCKSQGDIIPRAQACHWSINGRDLHPAQVPYERGTCSHTITNAQKSDSGTYGCSITNAIGTMKKNAVFIVTDRPQVQLNGSHVVTLNMATSLKLVCAYSVDSLVDDDTVEITWKVTSRPERVGASTIDPMYGLSLGAFSIDRAARVSELTISRTLQSMDNIFGNYTCTLSYAILKHKVTLESNTGSITASVGKGWASEAEQPSQFPFWVLGVVAAVATMVVLVLLIIFCMRHNKGKTYYVDEKERLAGHNNVYVLSQQVFKDFQRPDQEPLTDGTLSYGTD